MGYTVDKKTGKIILVHDVTVSSKAVKQPETQQQPPCPRFPPPLCPPRGLPLPARSLSRSQGKRFGRSGMRGTSGLWGMTFPLAWVLPDLKKLLLTIATMRKR